ncbi:uncharacterized protein BDW70DRAFT_125006 [Aspergillus foveolatus]|uniref:uncharacterized protein n=1 Tax=Aspergillus foveolatus TaxID=210207 RepID=UPI003CCDA8C3
MEWQELCAVLASTCIAAPRITQHRTMSLVLSCLLRVATIGEAYVRLRSGSLRLVRNASVDELEDEPLTAGLCRFSLPLLMVPGSLFYVC